MQKVIADTVKKSSQKPEVVIIKLIKENLDTIPEKAMIEFLKKYDYKDGARVDLKV